MNCWNWNTYFVDPLSLLCLTCFKADDVHWSTDDAGTIFHVNIFFHWEREECSKSVMHYGWDPSLTVLVIGDDNQPRVERTLNCKATEVVFLNNDWMWMWWVYSNYNKLLNIRHESKISLYSCRRTVKTTVKRKKKLPTPLKNPSKQTKQHLNTQQIKIKLGLFSFQKPCSKYFTLKVQLELFRVLVCI